MTAHLQLIKPNNENRSVRVRHRIPTRPSNRDLRPREYLTPSEVEKLIGAARKGRYGHRDATLILVAYRHGLRAVELCDLEWSQVEFDRAATVGAFFQCVEAEFNADRMKHGQCSEQIVLRVAPTLREGIERAASNEGRSLANMTRRSLNGGRLIRRERTRKSEDS